MNRFAPSTPTRERNPAQEIPRLAKQALHACEFEESEWSDVFHVLMEQGAFCDCEILYNAAEDSRLKARYWKAESVRRSHERHD